MAKFLLETDAVSSAASAISKTESNVTDAASTISGWDTSNEDGFNFDGAKSIISSNVEAIASKIKNVASALNIVVDSHTELQNSLRLDAEAVAKDNKSNEAKNEESSTNNTGYNPSVGTTPSGGYSSSASTSSSSGYRSSYNPGSSSRSSTPSSSSSKPKLAPVIPVAPNVKEKQERDEAAKEKAKKIVKPKTTPEVTPEETTKPEVVKEPETEQIPKTEDVQTENPTVEDVSYAVPKQEQLSEESIELFNNEVSYDESGYSKIGDRYVIAADTSLGQVGDVVRFTDQSGQTTECVIGVNTVTESNKNKMYFLVEENKTSVSPININTDITSSTIENLGNYQSVSSTIPSAAGVTALSGSMNINNEMVTENSINEDDLVEGDDSNG